MLLDPTDLGEAIRRLRGSRSQVEVARQAECPPSQWSVYERGKRWPSELTLRRILRGLGCSEEILFDELVKMRGRRVQGQARSSEFPSGDRLHDPGVQSLLTELRSLRAHLTMLSTYFIGLEHRVEQLLGEDHGS